jgi:hypothetical protein
VTITPKAPVPLHVLGRAGAAPVLDEVEVEHQVERGDSPRQQAEADADHPALVDVGTWTLKKPRIIVAR